MIITEFVEIKITKYNKNRYKSIYRYENIKIGDIINVPIKIAVPKNKFKVTVKCDLCGMERKILYSTYLESTKNETDIYTCKGKCTNIKRERTNMILYGVKNCFQNEEKKKLAKITMKKRHGAEYNMQCDKFLRAREKTYIDNYGVDNPTKDKTIFEKALESGKRIRYFEDTVLFYQGSYELEFLQKCKNMNILHFVKNGVTIKYKYNKRIRAYHADFMIDNTIIEIKSIYWYNKDKEICEMKKEACINQKYNYILILEKDYTEFDIFIKNLCYQYDKQSIVELFPIF